MQRKLATAAAVAMALYCPVPAIGETRISVRTSREDVAVLGRVRGQGRVTGVATHVDGRRTTLAFSLVTSSKSPVEISVPLHVVGDARVSSLVARIGGRELVTKALPDADARALFETIMTRKFDPVLVEHVATSAGSDELRIRAWPVTSTEPAHVELVIESAPVGGWTIDATPPAIVSDASSLIAVEDMSRLPTAIVCGGVGRAHWHGDLDAKTIRRYVKRQLPRVKGCYDTALLRDKTLAGRVELHFGVRGDGKTHDVSVDGEVTDEGLRACIADELARFEFPVVPDMPGTIRVNYPLTLQIFE